MQLDLYMTPGGEIGLWERACRKRDDQKYSRIICGPMGERLRPVDSEDPSDRGCGGTNLYQIRKGYYIIEAFQNRNGKPRMSAYQVKTVDWNRVQAIVQVVAKYGNDTWEMFPPEELIEPCAVALQKLGDNSKVYADRRDDPHRKNRRGDYLWAS